MKRAAKRFPPPSRGPVITPHAMVATSQPLAVDVGIDILKGGGNAVDAAIAVDAMLGLVEPMSCGLGGDVFAIVWDAGSERLYGLNGSGRAPRAMTRDVFVDLDRIPLHGPLSWTVPGCVDGWFALHERFGRLPLSELLAPTIEQAEKGFPVTPVIARAWQDSSARLRADPGARATFLRDDRPPQIGEILRNPDLARSLCRVADEGRDAFYCGPIADRIVTYSEEIGGLIALEDLAAHTSTWVEPVSIRYRGYEVWELPPNTQGIAALQMLAILEGYELNSLGPQSADYLHLLIETKKLVYEDRARYYADPAFAHVPVESLLSPEYVRERRSRINPERAARNVHAEDPELTRGDTVYLTVVDEGRNAVSFIQSIYDNFGSGVVPPGTGFAMQNRGSLFHLDPTHANVLEPGKRPFHTIIPAFVTRDDHPVFSFGVMGGDMQPQGHVQVLVNWIDFGMDVQEAGDAPRARHVGSSTPTGDAPSDGGSVRLELGFPETAIEGLRRRGHRVEVRPFGSNFGGYQGIWIDPESGLLHGGSDPRKDGRAGGY